MRQEKHLRAKVYTKDAILDQLRMMGVKHGDGLFVHASFSSIGNVDGGPEVVVDALLDAVGPEGHLMFPTFAFHIDLGPYDPDTTPTTMGILAETARKRDGFYRSDFPYNSVSVHGPQALHITENHVSRGHCRPGDPIDRFAMLGGYVLLIGVDFRSNTTVHIGECYADLPHRRMSMNGPYRRLLYADGERGIFNLSGLHGCDGGFGAVEGIMRESSHITDGFVGAAPTQLMRGKDVIFDVAALAERAPWSLYCNNPSCTQCIKYRQIVTDEYAGKNNTDGRRWDDSIMRKIHRG